MFSNDVANIAQFEREAKSLVFLDDCGMALTTSLIIADGVGKDHASVIKLIRNNILDLQEFGPVRFEIQQGRALPQGGFAASTEYAVLNEQQSTLLLTYMRNNIVVRKFKIGLVRSFFNLREQVAKPIVPTPLSTIEILEIAMKAEQEKLALAEKIKNDAPKVTFAETVSASPDSIDVGKAAKICGTGRQRMFAFLKRIAWITRTNEPYQRIIEQGLMEMKVREYHHPELGLKRSVQPLVTGKGLLKLQTLIQEQLYV
ncbi:hypothetical protein BOO36_17000 [Vibrio navarrensis]|uniref:phage antirepressor KilAC domain-containing protein n=1 Tax=Vibrio navarrensis TaxID=29495 RepID=UPI00186AA4CB|nr:phage regulatory protein/antirepressor Ant [Vibrio navarrensis]MBE4575502.1 hypothetical protein [Vibrio navarrensis]